MIFIGLPVNSLKYFKGPSSLDISESLPIVSIFTSNADIESREDSIFLDIISRLSIDISN